MAYNIVSTFYSDSLAHIKLILQHLIGEQNFGKDIVLSLVK